MTKNITVLAVFLLFCTISCKKYEEGPLISLRSKKSRIANKWKVANLFKNGVDSTKYYAAEGTWIELGKDGDAVIMLIQSNGIVSDTTNSEGRWELHEKNTVIALILTDLLTNEVDTNFWWITRLKEKEFWFEEKDKDNDGNPDEEIRLVPFE